MSPRGALKNCMQEDLTNNAHIFDVQYNHFVFAIATWMHHPMNLEQLLIACFNFADVHLLAKKSNLLCPKFIHVVLFATKLGEYFAHAFIAHGMHGLGNQMFSCYSWRRIRSTPFLGTMALVCFFQQLCMSLTVVVDATSSIDEGICRPLQKLVSQIRVSVYDLEGTTPR